MERVAGIGGLFFRARDPAALSRWYDAHLGVPAPPPSYDDADWWQQAGPTVWGPFPPDSDHFGRLEQTWAISFRVRDLDAMVEQLTRAGVEVSVHPQTYPNGRFADAVDPEGNPIQLWEPGGRALDPPVRARGRKMRFALLLYLDPAAAARTTAAEADAELAAYGSITGELAASGVLRGGEALMPAGSATVVRIEDGRRVLGQPPARGLELSGFYVLDCEEQAAVDIAARMPVARHGVVEVRRVMTFPDAEPATPPRD